MIYWSNVLQINGILEFWEQAYLEKLTTNLLIKLMVLFFAMTNTNYCGLDKILKELLCLHDFKLVNISSY